MRTGFDPKSVSRLTSVRKQVEAELREREEQYRNIFEAIADPVIVAEFNGFIRDANPAACREYGYAREELVGQRLETLVHDSSQATLSEGLAEVRAGRSCSSEYLGVRQDGSTFVAAVWNIPFNLMGEPVVLCMTHNIAARKQAEESLRESEEQFRVIADTAPVLIWMSGPDKLCTYFNAGWLQYTGRTMEQELGNGWAEGVHPEDFDRCLKTYTEAFDRREPFEMEYRLRRADGSYGWIHDRGVARQLPDGRFAGYLGACIDTTERKQAELKLHETEATIREMQAITSDAASSFDERVEALLRLGCRRFGLPIGMVTERAGEALRLTHVYAPGSAFHAGDTIPVSRTYCQEVLRRDEPIDFSHAGASPEWRTHPGYATLVMESYLGTSVRTGGSAVGTICFISPDPRPSGFSDADRDVLRLMARWIGVELDRRRAETELRDSEARLRALYDDSPSMYFTIAPDGTVLSVNRFGAQRLGYQSDELIGSCVSAVIHEDDEEIVHCALAKAFANPTELTSLEFREVTREGTVMWVRELIRVLPAAAAAAAAAGSGPVALIVCEDITDRKQAEEAQRRLAAIVTSSDDAIVSKTLDGIVTSWNRGAEQLFGYRTDEMVGQPITRLFPPDRLAEEFDILRRMRRGESIDHFETVRVKKNGDLVDLSLTISPMKNKEGAVIGISKIARDITERKRVEAALRNSEEQLRSLTDSVPVLIAQVGADLRYRFVNDRYARLFGRAVEEFVGRHSREVLGEETFAQAAPHMMEALKGTQVAYDLDLRDAAGNSLTVHVTYVPEFDGAGTVTGFIAAITDITARKQAETALHESHQRLRDVTRQLASAEERERRRIARELHDEFGQALTGLNFDLAAVVRKIAQLADSPERGAMQARTESMTQGIDRLMKSVRITATALRPPVLDDLGLAAGLEWLADWFRGHTGRGCTVTVDPATDIDALGFELSSTVFRAAQELVTNVARHADASTAAIRLSVQEGQVRLTVQDDGQGLHENALQKRTSLGLRGLRERVEMLGGTMVVIVNGSPGKGTTVSVAIPIERDVVRAQKEPT